MMTEQIPNSQSTRKSHYPIYHTESEMDRLTFQNSVYTELVGDRFLPSIEHFSIDTTLRILDVGSGPGTWANDIGFILPKSSIYGFDLFPISLPYQARNVQFRVADVERPPLPYDSSSFDIIHARNMFLAITDWERYFRELKRLVIPETGSIHVVETIIPPIDSKFDMTHIIQRYLTLSGVSFFINPDNLEECARKAGLTITDRREYPFAIGNWPEDPREKRVGVLAKSAFAEGFESFLSYLAESFRVSEEERNRYFKSLEEYIETSRISLKLYSLVLKRID
ncbi:S-adenosyl-L-methionine-dependent methyltransferase [Dipodascopsis uninucleata]